MKKIIAISGTHGTGKTYSAYNLCTQMKKNGKNVVVLDELARESPFEINQIAGDETQIWLMCKQITRELELMNRYEFVITDRSVLDAFCYGLTIKNNHNWINGNLISYLTEHIKKYYSKLYILNPIYFNYNIEDGVRDTDEIFRMDVHENIIKTLKKFKIDYTLIESKSQIHGEINGNL